MKTLPDLITLTTSRHVFRICPVRISAEGLASWCSPLYLCHPKQIPVQHLYCAVTTYSQIPSILPKRPDRLWGSPKLIFDKYRGSFSGVKRTGRDVDHSLPSSVGVKNEWKYTLLPLQVFTASTCTTSPFYTPHGMLPCVPYYV
jgi:hypothetical protein